MGVLGWIVLFSLLGGVISALAAGAFLLFPERFRMRLLPHLVSFAIGALLGAAFLDLLPEALESSGADVHSVTTTVLFGLLAFFFLEKVVLWRHAHSHPGDADCAEHTHHHTGGGQAAGTLILFGDGLHNFVDGILIAAAFLTDIRLGIVTSIAVAAHEVPQEVGDFAILLHSGYGRGKALLYNMLSSLATVVGGVLAYYSFSGVTQLLPYVLAIAASSFIYIAVADLLPDLHKRTAARATLQQTGLIALGILLIYISHLLGPH
jgi:zinc and cadmium transporter